ELTRSLPAPLSLFWRPALDRLALEGRRQGIAVTLTGDGADDWLQQNAFLAADLLRALDLAGFYRLWRGYCRSFHFTRIEALRMLLWRYGARPLLRDAWRGAATRTSLPGLVPGLWRLPSTTSGLIAAPLPDWLAPDPGLRARVNARLAESCSNSAGEPRPDNYYFRDIRARLAAPEKAFREEETFLTGQRTGVPVRQPFWDRDLIDLLVRVRPVARTENGMSKALVRRPLARRFPRLGFEGQRKSWLGGAMLSAIAAQIDQQRAAMDELRSLRVLGVIDMKSLDAALAAKSPRSRLATEWEIFNLEAWARARR